MSTNHAFDASSVVRLRSSHCSSHDVSYDAFSLTLTTLTLNQSSLRLFKASPCRAALEGPPPSLPELRHLKTSCLSSCLVAHTLVHGSACGTMMPRHSRARKSRWHRNIRSVTSKIYKKAVLRPDLKGIRGRASQARRPHDLVLGRRASRLASTRWRKAGFENAQARACRGRRICTRKTATADSEP